MFSNMEFQYLYNIPYFAIAAMAAVLLVLAFRKKDRIIAALSLNFRTRLKALRTALLFAGLGLMSFSLLGPQAFAGYVEATKSGMDIYVLIDTSKSMLVTDIAPDRITVAKRIVGDLLDNLDGDRIGFIPFASDAYIQMPLTDDYMLARMFLDVIDTDMISGGGTNMAAAVRLAGDSFKRTSSADRVVIILSDGEEHEGASLDVLKRITDDQIKIFTIGIGTETGGPVPVYNRAGDAVIDYMRDSDGNLVTSRLEAETLWQLAYDGRGAYYQATLQGAETISLLEDLSSLERDELEARSIKRFDQKYQYFLGAGILLTMAAVLLPERGKAV